MGKGFWVDEDSEDQELLTPVHYTDSAPEEPDEEVDLLAPVHYTDSAAEAPEEDDAEFWSDDDGGVSDRERIIRVWVEQGRLTRVRISSGWAAKLERRTPATLADVATAVLRVAHVGVAGSSSLLQDAPTVELTRKFARSLPDASPATLEAMTGHYRKKHKEFSQALQDAARNQAKATPVRARSEGVTVTLDERGHATSLTIDQTWLDRTHAGAISAAIMTAAQEAYERFEAEPSPERQAIHEVAREYDYLRKVMHTILLPKDRR